MRGLTASAALALTVLLSGCGADAAPATDTVSEHTDVPEAELGEAEVRAKDGGLITRLYEGSITLSDGRTLPCVVTNRGAVTCEWSSSPELENQLMKLLEEKQKAR